MTRRSPKRKRPAKPPSPLAKRLTAYDAVLADVMDLLHSARSAAARSVNTIMTATYWKIGQRIVEHEQAGADRADYATDLIKRLGADLTNRFGRGFGWRNLYQMRAF